MKHPFTYIERTFGKPYADKFRSTLIALFHKLAGMPTAGRVAKTDRSIRVFIFQPPKQGDLQRH